MVSTDELLADLDDRETEEPSTRQRSADGDSQGLRARLGSRIGDVFSVRAFLAALALSTVGLFASSIVPLLPTGISALLGVFAGAFVLGLVASTRRYAESAAAGAGVAAVATLADVLFITLLTGFAPALAVVSGGAGLLAGLVGHYFGRDLRAGLTRDVS